MSIPFPIMLPISLISIFGDCEAVQAIQILRPSKSRRSAKMKLYLTRGGGKLAAYNPVDGSEESLITTGTKIVKGECDRMLVAERWTRKVLRKWRC
jgi:hypothetical protein